MGLSQSKKKSKTKTGRNTCVCRKNSENGLPPICLSVHHSCCCDMYSSLHCRLPPNCYHHCSCKTFTSATCLKLQDHDCSCELYAKRRVAKVPASTCKALTTHECVHSICPHACLKRVGHKCYCRFLYHSQKAKSCSYEPHECICDLDTSQCKLSGKHQCVCDIPKPALVCMYHPDTQRPSKDHQPLAYEDPPPPPVYKNV